MKAKDERIIRRATKLVEQIEKGLITNDKLKVVVLETQLHNLNKVSSPSIPEGIEVANKVRKMLRELW